MQKKFDRLGVRGTLGLPITDTWNHIRLRVSRYPRQNEGERELGESERVGDQYKGRRRPEG